MSKTSWFFVSAVVLTAFSVWQLPSPTSFAAEIPPTTSFTFTATGDIGARDLTTRTLQDMAAEGGAFTLALGDLSYNHLTPESAWCDYIKGIFGQTYPFQLEVGNHENGLEAGGPNGYIENFAQCLPDRLGAVGTYGRQYYFDYPATNALARFIMLPAGESATSGGPRVNYTNGSTEQQWLNNTIDQARAVGIKWIIVGMHMLCPTVGEKGCSTWQASPGPDLFNFLVSKKVDLVLHGHDHNYQRSKQFALGPGCTSVPVESNALPPMGAADMDCIADSDDSLTKGAGTVIVISGITPNYQWPSGVNASDLEAPYFKAFQSSNYGYTKVTVSADQLTSQFVRTGATSVNSPIFSDGFTISDSGTVPPPGDTTAPSVPTNLTATAVSTSQINLSWTVATDNVGVTGYSVFRDGARVATSTGITYSDIGLTASTTYSYTVAAFDAAGNVSVQSSPVSATTQTASGAASFVNDTFTDVNGTNLASHTSDSGAVWTKSPGGSGANLTIDTNHIYQSTNGGWQLYYTSAVSTNADYDVQADYLVYNPGHTTAMICGRIDTSSQNGYCVRYGNGIWHLFKRVGATYTTLGSYTGDVPLSATTVKLQMRGAQLDVFIGANDRISVTDGSPIILAGRAGVATYYADPVTTRYLDNWSAVNPDAGEPPPPPPPGDTTAPTVPTNLTATAVSPSQVNLSWAASTDNVSVTGYKVFRDGSQVATSTVITYSDINLVASTTYAYTVVAFDAAGNASLQSASASATTQAIPPPSIVGFASDSFTGVDGTLLQNHVSDSGATWTKSTGGGGGNLVFNTNRISPSSTSSWQPYYTSAVSASADYDVLADVTAPHSGATSPLICGRIATDSLNAYCFGLNNGVWKLYKRVGSTYTLLGTYTGNLSAAPVAVKLSMRGSQLDAYVAGVSRISVTDSSLVAAGRAGVALFYSDASTSRFLDNWSAWNPE